MRVEFRLLGDVEAYVDGRRLDTGHSRQRCVLGALLVDANRPVPADQLIDRVWADQPPLRARNALAAYLSRLRQLLAEADGVRITREPGGYLLATELGSVDLYLFRDLVSKARASEDPVAAAALFAQALDLWRGEPFGSLDTPWVNDVRAALEAERRAVTLDRNDVALRVGHHAELLLELSTALQANPLDERLAGQLMLAQYRNGRQADALETYRRTRERLVDELGADPGPSLREVHQQILEGDRTFVDPVVRPSDPPAPSPQLPVVTLPRRMTSFIGRADEVGQVAVALRESPLVTLTGVGGMGKTRLAIEAAGGEQGRFADGVWLCELAPLEASADGAVVGQALAATLRLQQQQGLDIATTVMAHLQSRELLLVVDNCEHVLEAAAELVDQIVRQCSGVSVLATSRAALGVEGERILPVPPLPDEDAATLFADRARAGKPDFDLAREPVGAVAEICRRLDGMPLAIELAAARMRAMSSLDVARRLDRLRLLSGGTRGGAARQQSLVATIDWSYRLLSEAEQSLFARLSIFAGGFDLDAAHGICGEKGATEDDTLELLAGLVDKSMVVVRGGTDRSRYGVLETLRAYGRDRLRDNGVEEEFATRHAEYFIELLERGTAAMYGPDERAWVERMAPDAGTLYTAPDYDNVRAAFERAIAVQDGELALRLVTSLTDLVQNRVGYHSIEWMLRALEIADPDHPLYPGAAGAAARAAWVLGEFDHARSLAELAGGRVPLPGISYLGYPADVLADVALLDGDVAAHFAHYDAEILTARQEADPVRLVWVLYNLSIAHTVGHESEAGLADAQEAMRVADRIANPSMRAMARCSLGRVLKKSDPDRALALFDEAHRLAAPVQNNWLTGIAVTEAATVRAMHGDPATAARMYLDVLAHWSRAGPGTGCQHWLTLRSVTQFLARRGAVEDALALHHLLVNAGRPSPLDAERLAALVDEVGDEFDAEELDAGEIGAAAVARACAGLRRFV